MYTRVSWLVGSLVVDRCVSSFFRPTAGVSGLRRVRRLCGAVLRMPIYVFQIYSLLCVTHRAVCAGWLRFAIQDARIAYEHRRERRRARRKVGSKSQHSINGCLLYTSPSPRDRG